MTSTITTYRPSLLTRGVFDDIFDTMLDMPSLINKTTKGYPVADIYKEQDGSTTMEFALAGFDKENLHIEIYPNRGTIEISSDSHGDEEEINFSSRRIARRAFHKTFVNYDNDLDLTSARADYKNGLLRINLPLKDAEGPMKIEIS